MINSMRWFVYCIRCKHTGKKYYGRSWHNPYTGGIQAALIRRQGLNGGNYRKNPDLYNDICKYGWLDGFDVFPVSEFNNRMDCIECENHWITTQETHISGYNRTKHNVSY